MPVLPTRIAFLLVALWLAPAAAAETILVKLQRTGPHAVRACAEATTRGGTPLAGVTADGSGSLDVLLRRHEVQRVRGWLREEGSRSLEAAQRSLRRRFDRRGEALAHVYRMVLPPGADVDAAVADFARDPHVAWAQRDFPVALDRALDDPFLTSSGSWRQPHADLWGLHRIGIEDAWDRTLGEGIVVAVVDTGLELDHPDIAANLWLNPGEDLDGNGRVDPVERNGIDDDGNGFIDDFHGFDFHDSVDANEDGDYADPGDVSDADPNDRNGHGTHVAGTVAARGGNGIGIAGVAPRAQVMAVKVFPDRGSARTQDVWRGVLYAAENGARVINASFSCSPRCPSNPLAEEIVRVVHDLGVVFVTSAGNRADDMLLTSPEKLRETLAVGSIRPDDAEAPTSSYGLRVDVVAPGEAVLSLKIEDASIWSPRRFVGDDYMFLEGTSMATPHVAGVAALLLSVHPDWGPEQVRTRLRQTAEDLGAAGPDRQFGPGLLRADRALADTPTVDAWARFESPLPGSDLPGEAGAAIAIDSGGRELSALRLEIGRGHGPDVWTPIALPDFGPARVDFDATGQEDARWTLRLVAFTALGTRLTEYLPVQLDRNAPVFVSPQGSSAQDPDVSGDRVVWAAPRLETEAFVSDRDLRFGRFGVAGTETWFAAAPGDPLVPRLSRFGLGWRAREAGGANAPARIAACRFLRDPSRCASTESPETVARIAEPVLSGRRLAYAASVPGGHEVRVCTLGSSGCAARAATPVATRYPTPQLDGRRLLWVDRDGPTNRLFTCRYGARGPCTPLATQVANALHLVPRGLDGDLVVYEDAFLTSTLEYRLRACRLDFETGACPPATLDRSTAIIPADASDGRIVWSSPRGTDEPDVMLCRLDAGEPRCPVQRVNQHPAAQTQPRIDGHRLVWVDDRDELPRIASLALPTLARLFDRRAEAGRPVVIALRETTRAAPVRFELTNAAGLPPETLGMRLETGRVGRAQVVWTPGPEHVGVHRLRVRAVRESGLYDEASFALEVAPAQSSR